MGQRVKKRFDIYVTEIGAVYSKTFELDKTISLIHGLVFTADRDDLLYYRGTAKIEINREEIFPEGYEIKLLMTGLNVAPDERFYTIGPLSTGNGKIKVDFKDNPDNRLAFAAYRVSIYLDCENADT